MNTRLNLSVRLWVVMLALLLMPKLSNIVLAMEPKLKQIQTKIERDFKVVHHIATQEFSMLSRDRVMIFDVRGQAEYDVSHIEGAIRIDPNMSPYAFMHIYSNTLNGKIIVFYCSVGRRSSAFASSVNTLVKKSGVTGSYNLAGGLFQWHHEERLLMQNGKPTNAIHPYNWFWSRLISNKNAIRYLPEKPIPSTTSTF